MLEVYAGGDQDHTDSFEWPPHKGGCAPRGLVTAYTLFPWILIVDTKR